MRQLISFVFLSLFIGLVGKGWYELKEGFSFRRLEGPFPELRSEDPPFSLEAQKALGQKFRYLGGGRQSYAFLSQDEKYVLKFPRLDLYKQPFARSLSLARQDKRKRRLENLVRSFLIADEDLRESAQIVHCHLNLREFGLPIVQLSDNLGQTVRLDLNRYPFVLQRNMASWFKEFEESVQKGDRERSQSLLIGYLKCLGLVAKKGVFDKDPFFQSNLGVDENRVGQIDLGNLCRKEGICSEEVFLKAFREGVSRMSGWLRIHAPEFNEWFLSQAENYDKN